MEYPQGGGAGAVPSNTALAIRGCHHSGLSLPKREIEYWAAGSEDLESDPA